MIYLLKILKAIHTIADKIEEGKPFEFTDVIGNIDLAVTVTEVSSIDDKDLVIGHTDGRKLSAILVDDMLDVLFGRDVNQDIAIVMPSEDGESRYLLANVTATA